MVYRTVTMGPVLFAKVTKNCIFERGYESYSDTTWSPSTRARYGILLIYRWRLPPYVQPYRQVVSTIVTFDSNIIQSGSRIWGKPMLTRVYIHNQINWSKFHKTTVRGNIILTQIRSCKDRATYSSTCNFN